MDNTHHSGIRRIAGLLVLIFTLIPSGLDADKQREAEIVRHMHTISSHSLLDDVRHLASEEYAGRLSGTEEYRASAEWVASRFKQWNLQPGGDSGTYLQSFPNPYTIVFEGGDLTLEGKDGEAGKNYLYKQDYYPGSSSASNRLSADVVYVGFGISAPELNYDDYQGIDVEDKIVLMESGLPLSPDRAPSEHEEWQVYAPLNLKLKMAVAHGARGALVHELRVNAHPDSIQDFPVSMVGQTVVDDLFAKSDRNHAETVGEITSKIRPLSFATERTVTMENFTEFHPEGVGYNVIGVLEGADPELSQETILIAANLDHVGFCYEVVPGANDNASGMAVLLGLARALAGSPVRPARTIVFAGFGANEHQYLGSNVYFSAPARPFDSIPCAVYLEKVGCGTALFAYGGQPHEKLWKILREADEDVIHRGIQTRDYDQALRLNLDIERFLKKGVPCLILTAVGKECPSHTPEDTPDILSPELLEDLTRWLYVAVLKLDEKKAKDLRS